jgi:hypothetical protein
MAEVDGTFVSSLLTLSKLGLREASSDAVAASGEFGLRQMTYLKGRLKLRLSLECDQIRARLPIASYALFY